MPRIRVIVSKNDTEIQNTVEPAYCDYFGSDQK